MPIKTQSDQPPSLNLTPMIDILFLLIIFFMVGTQFTELDRALDVEVPSVSSSVASQSRPAYRTVVVGRDGTVYLDDESIGLRKLTERLASQRELHGELSVVIRGDAQGAFQHVASVLSACRQAGVVDISVAVRPNASHRY